MSQVRKAHSVEIIDRRLRDCMSVDAPDVMELIGLHDELSRVERKWREKFASPRPATEKTRPLADAAAMNLRFEKLTRLIDVTLRRQVGATDELQMLAGIKKQLDERTPLETAR